MTSKHLYCSCVCGFIVVMIRSVTCKYLTCWQTLEDNEGTLLPHTHTHTVDDQDMFDSEVSGHRSFHFVFQRKKKKHKPNNKITFCLNIYLCAFKGGHQQAGRKRDKGRGGWKTGTAKCWGSFFFIKEGLKASPLAAQTWWNRPSSYDEICGVI